MIDGRGAPPGERRGGRVAGVKNKATLEHENLISRAIGKLDRPLGKEVLAEVMMELRGMAQVLAEAARAGDKEALQKRVYYQGTLETDKANYWSPAFASRARGMPGSRTNHYRYLGRLFITARNARGPARPPQSQVWALTWPPEPGPPAAVCGLAADLQPAPARAHAAGGAGLQQPSPTPRTAHAEKTAPCRGTIASVTRLELRPRCPDVTKPTSNSPSQL